jgi:hypothetical protein
LLFPWDSTRHGISYGIPIPTRFLSYKSKEPLQEYGLSEIGHQTCQWIYHQLLIPDVLYSDYHKAPLSGSAIFADTLPATGKDFVIPTGKLEIQTPKVYHSTCNSRE